MTDDLQPPDVSSEKPRGRRRLRRPRLGTHPVAMVVTSALVVVAALTSAGVTMVYNDLNGNISANAFHAAFAPGYESPNKMRFTDAAHQPLNILVMGSDTRNCAGCRIDNQTGGGSDTTLLIHLSRDRQHAYGISIPRDTVVNRPECANKDGAIFPAADSQIWNAAYSLAGPGCTIEQFQELSHIAIDDSIVVDFAGFKDMVNAVGGVQVCIPQTIQDQSHGIVLQAGTRTINGDEALAYVRERHGVGDGSDLGRIKRQQAFIASMVHAVLSARTLASPVKVLRFLKAATQTLKFDDQGINNLKDLAELGAGFNGIGLDKIKFLTIPIMTDPADVNRVVEAPTADRVWKLLKKDKPLPAGLTSTAIKAGAVPGDPTKHHKKNRSQSSEFANAGLCTG